MKNIKKSNQSILTNSSIAFAMVMMFLSSNLYAEEMKSAAITQEDVQQRETKTLDLLTRIDAFTEEDERLRSDAAKAHYNMGNIYFQKGEFELSAREYYQAITLMPHDADSHYNLAFVSGRYLKDFQTSLKHFRMYLYLNPSARDAKFAKEQIAHALLILGGKMDSPLEERDR